MCLTESVQVRYLAHTGVSGRQIIPISPPPRCPRRPYAGAQTTRVIGLGGLMGRLENKVLLVSGGGADGPPKADEPVAMGNGRATAILAAREGAAVMVVDRALEGAAKTAEMIRSEGGRAEAFAADVRDEEACRDAVGAAVKAFGGLHLL